MMIDQIDRCQIDRQIDARQVDRQTDRQMDGWMGNQLYKQRKKASVRRERPWCVLEN